MAMVRLYRYSIGILNLLLNQSYSLCFRSKREFDCDSLRDYKNETVTLRLPGTMDIKDVFWFSVFSIPQSVSLSHLYVPYNDMHLPPDLIGISVS
jgi:hypothetical protein